jgi:TnpA family transposase
LKRVPLGNAGVSYRDLLYIRRRFITKEAVRQAIAAVVNGIFAVRFPQI